MIRKWINNMIHTKFKTYIRNYGSLSEGKGKRAPRDVNTDFRPRNTSGFLSRDTIMLGFVILCYEHYAIFRRRRL
jgi:hypothetical protein